MVGKLLLSWQESRPGHQIILLVVVVSFAMYLLLTKQQQQKKKKVSFPYEYP